MKEFVEYIVRALVEYPESVRISEIDGKRNIIMELRCRSEDMGRLIGKSGKTIGAIRVLLAGLAARQGRKAVLEIVE